MGEPLFEYFKSLKERSKKPSILAIVGAGLSAPSGLPASHHPNTEADIVWRNYTAIDLATPDAFDANPALVWMYYAYRRHMALNASPNRAHYLLKELSECEGLEFLTISQNMDGLSRRAGHFKRLVEFHGSLFSVKCTNFSCFYQATNYDDPLTPLLDVETWGDSLPKITELSQLPTCPLCGDLLRPGVVWFGESLPLYVVDQVDEFIIGHGIDLLIIVGTSHSIWPVSSYIDIAHNQGGNIAVFNTQPDDIRSTYDDETTVWEFIGDCSSTLPKVFNPIINLYKK